jgi:glycosyltransferase involved in cell wall biosynthesis
MRISLLAPTTYPTPPNTYGGESFIYQLAVGLHELGHKVILYAAKNNDIDYPFQLNQLPWTHGQVSWVAEGQAWDYYKNDIMNSDVILDLSHGKQISERLHNFKIKKEVANYMIGNWYLHPFPTYNIIVNSKKQLEDGIAGRTGFEGTPWEVKGSSNGKIPETSKYAPLGIDTDFYKFDENKEDYFLWLARFHPHKNPMIAIRLAKETGINLILSGDRLSHPEHYRHWEECMNQIKGCDNIKYIELPQDNTHQSAKMKLMQKAKCYLFPVQFHESFGLTTVEALSCGTPIIANAMGALPEIIKHGETGFLCNDYQHMKTFVNSIDEICPRDCRKDIEKRFSREAMSKRFEKILIDLYNGETW